MKVLGKFTTWSPHGDSWRDYRRLASPNPTNHNSYEIVLNQPDMWSSSKHEQYFWCMERVAAILRTILEVLTTFPCLWVRVRVQVYSSIGGIGCRRCKSKHKFRTAIQTLIRYNMQPFLRLRVYIAIQDKSKWRHTLQAAWPGIWRSNASFRVRTCRRIYTGDMDKCSHNSPLFHRL